MAACLPPRCRAAKSYYPPLRPLVLCVVNVNSAEQSCDSETRLKPQVMKFASDNLDNWPPPIAAVIGFHAYVAQGISYRWLVSESGKEPVSSSRARLALNSTPPLRLLSKPRATASHAQEFCQLSEITG